MKKFRIFRKRTLKKYAKKNRSNFRSVVKSSGLYVIPPRIRTKMALSFTATVATGFLATTGTYFNVYANSIYRPFDTSSAPINGGFTLTQGSNVSNSPIGYTVLSAQYGRYKVISVRYELSVVVGNNTDTMAVGAYPFVWSTGTAGLNPWNSQAQPGGVYKVMNQSGESSTSNKLVININNRKALGMTAAQYAAQLDTPTGTNPGQLLACNFGFEPLNATTNAQPVSLDIRAVYLVEWSSPIVLVN